MGRSERAVTRPRARSARLPSSPRGAGTLAIPAPLPLLLGMLLLGVLAGCGSKTGLPIPSAPPEDASVEPDATPIPDGGRPDAFVPPPPPDECIELPPREPPEFVDVGFLARIATADVLFLVDVTGSMTEEIAQIRRSLRDVIAPGLADAIEDVHLSVAEFADFPVIPYGDETDIPFRLITPSTAGVSEVQRGVDALVERSGSDIPESHVEALYQAATGEGLGRYVRPAICASDRVGGACFRESGSRIVLLFTDAEMHEGPGGSNPYTEPPISPRPHRYEDAVNALRGIGAKVLGLYSGGEGGGSQALRDLQQIARDTGAVTRDGQPVWVNIGFSGERLDDGVIDVVRTLVEEVPIDIDVLVEDWPGDEVDALEFVDGVRTLGADRASGATDLGDRYEAVQPGTRVRFRIGLANERIERGPEPQTYYLTIVLRGDGVTRLRETVVQVVIPARDGRGCESVE